MKEFQKGDKVRVKIVNGQDFPQHLLRRVGTIVQIQEHYGTTADIIVRFRTGEFVEIDEVNLVAAGKLVTSVVATEQTLDELEENVIEFVANIGDWRRLNGLRRGEEAKYRLEVARRVRAA